MSPWQGRDDTTSEGELALRWHQMVRPYLSNSSLSSDKHHIVLLGFPSDEGIRRNQGRTGAAHGPQALREALAPLAWHTTNSVYDAGNITFHEQQLEVGQRALGMAVADILLHSDLPLVLGGGHETAYGTFSGIIHAWQKNTEERNTTRSSPEQHQNKSEQKLGIVNLDAHFDLRSCSVAHSGTPFAQMADWCHMHGQAFHYLPIGISRAANTKALWERASSLGVVPITDIELASDCKRNYMPRITEFVENVDTLYLSIDLDVLPAYVMPGVSSPAGLGVSLIRLLEIICMVASSGKLVAADVVEYNPKLDHLSIGAKTAASIIWELCQHWQPAPWR
ncbi:MAG TPA: formimidoylglutamase [Gemmatales bacterium]|nr:formimidoylglutamase [Gemmatales bacterium]